MIGGSGTVAGFQQPTVDRLANGPFGLVKLVERDNVLSAALGACVCWGRRAER
jgi:hypothetical protein